MYLVQKVAPISYPLSLTNAKDFMRTLEIDDDAMIQSMIISAVEYVENYTNRQLNDATFELYNDCIMQDWKLPKNPIKSISKIEHMDENGDYQILANTDYYLYGEDDVSRVHFENIPSHKVHKNAIKVTFISGYDIVPYGILAYLKVFVSTIYENRERYVIGVSVETMANPIIDKMLDMYRVQPI